MSALNTAYLRQPEQLTTYNLPFHAGQRKAEAGRECFKLSRRDSLTAEAVASLRLVPLSCNLAYLVSQLVYLNNYEVRMWFYRLGYHGQRCDCCGVCS